MQMRLADYVAELLVANGITDCFTVTGGGAMHLNDALGHKKGLTCLYNHHEQASAMAAEAYARVHNRIAAVCVTSGPGGTNALTGVLARGLILSRCLCCRGRCATRIPHALPILGCAHSAIRSLTSHAPRVL